MPLYDYKCEKCGEELKDHPARFTDPPPICCDQWMVKSITTHKGYTINGNNSASTTPRKKH